MALPWKVLDRFSTEDEGILELRQRGQDDFLITVGSQVLMNSRAQRSEIALGKLGCRKLKDHPNPQVLVGGLGMGITLRAVLDELPQTARVVVAELNPVIQQWCLGPLAALTAGAASDPRVTIEIADVAALIRNSLPESFDAIILDLYRGPHPQTDRVKDPIYGSRAIANCRSALKPGGIFAVWGENPDVGFEGRLASGGFRVKCERPGRGGYRHAVWVAEKGSAGPPKRPRH
jgi:spermidine synthase